MLVTMSPLTTMKSSFITLRSAISRRTSPKEEASAFTPTAFIFALYLCYLCSSRIYSRKNLEAMIISLTLLLIRNSII